MTSAAGRTKPPRPTGRPRSRWAGPRPPFRGAVIETGVWTRRVTLVLAVAAIAYLGFHATVSVFLALEHSLRFGGYAMDGAFQLYNPLRRLADGQVIGRDFPFFHGVGVPLLHYPVFAALGENLFASEMSRWLMSPVLFFATGYVFFRVLLGGWQRAFIALAIYVAIVIPKVNNIVEPGNSLIGIRTMAPLLIAAALLATPRKDRRIAGFVQTNTPLLVAYALLGVAVALGTEQGLAATGAFLLVRFFLNWRRLRLGWRLIVQTAVDAAAAVFSIFVTLSILTLGNAPAALRYALIDVPQDQGWVFGAVPNVTVTLDSLWWALIGGPELVIGGEVPRYWITGLIAAALMIIATRMRIVGQREISVSFFLWIYGVAVLVSLIGYINLADQLAPFGRVSAAILAGLVVSMGLTLVSRAESGRRRATSAGGSPRSWYLPVIRLVAASGLLVAVIAAALQSVPMRDEILKSVPKKALVGALISGPWDDYAVSSDGWRATLDQFGALIPPGASIWSTYSSLYESTRDVFNPAPGGEDYIIHALGPQRREEYQRAFAADPPDAVITMNPYYTAYEEWLWSRYPDFYEALLTKYSIASISGSHVLWLPNDDPPSGQDRSPSVIAAPVADNGSITLPANEGDELRYYALTVDYLASGGDIPILNRLPRFYLLPEGAALGLYGLILPPDRTEWSLIVPVFPGDGPVVLTPAIAGVNVGAALTIESAEYSVLDVAPQNAELAEMNFCFWKPEDARCEG